MGVLKIFGWVALGLVGLVVAGLLLLALAIAGVSLAIAIASRDYH